MNKRLHAFVTGRVQGVFFRVFVKKNADSLGLKGWVRNVDDGRVEAVAEGGEGELLKLVSALKKGPEGARVAQVQEKWETAQGRFKEFEIMHNY